MKKAFISILFLVIFLGFTVSTWATRVLTVPTADLLTAGRCELNCNYLNKQGSLELNMGLHPRISLGLRQNLGGSLGALAKISILEEGISYPGLALGGELSLSGPQVYVVASKQLGTPTLRAHVAWGNGRYARGMAAVDLLLNPVQVKTEKGWSLPPVSLALEYNGQSLNSGLTAQFTPDFQGYVAASLGTGWGLGINYQVQF